MQLKDRIKDKNIRDMLDVIPIEDKMWETYIKEFIM